MNNNFNNFQNSRATNRLTISEQIDILYSENNNLKNYVCQLKFEKEEIIKQYEEKLGYLEYSKSVVSQDFANSYNHYESEISNLSQEVKNLKNTLNEQLYEKKSMQEDYRKLEERYRVAKEYINGLPTPQESDKINKNLNRLKADNDRLRKQNHDCESLTKRLESELCEKNVEIANLNDKEVITKSQMDLLSEKLSRTQCNPLIKQEAMDSNWNSTPDLFEDMKITIDKYKNELIICRQLVESEKLKYNRYVSRYQSKIDELQIQLDSETETIRTLRKELENKNSTCNDLEKKLKMNMNKSLNIELEECKDILRQSLKEKKAMEERLQYSEHMRSTFLAQSQSLTSLKSVHRALSRRYSDLSRKHSRLQYANNMGTTSMDPPSLTVAPRKGARPNKRSRQRLRNAKIANGTLTEASIKTSICISTISTQSVGYSEAYYDKSLRPLTGYPNFRDRGITVQRGSVPPESRVAMEISPVLSFFP